MRFAVIVVYSRLSLDAVYTGTLPSAVQGPTAGSVHAPCNPMSAQSETLRMCQASR